MNNLNISYMSMALVGIVSTVSDKQQHVVVNGAKSDWAPFCQASPRVLGTLLFSLYINDTVEAIDSE